MPIVSTVSGLRLNHDTNADFMEQAGLKEWSSDADKEAKELQITFGGQLSENYSQKEFNKYVFSGEYNKKQGYWEVDPVFRVTTEDFSLYNQLRLMEWFTEHNMGMARYEPDIADVRIDKVGEKAGISMPIWILDFIIGSGILKKTEKIVKLPGIPYVFEDDFAGSPELTETMLELYKLRKGNKDQQYATYSETPEFKKYEKRFAKFNLKECEYVALEKDKVKAGAGK